MKLFSTGCLCLLSQLVYNTIAAQAPANKALSNLSITAVNTSLIPYANNKADLGTLKQKWKNVYTYNLIFSDGSTQTRAFTPYVAGPGISITGNIISHTGTASHWQSNQGTVFCNSANIGIGINSTTARLEVAGGDAKINGITIGIGNGAVSSNTVVGRQALYNNSSGFSNTAYGNLALFTNADGYDNAALGENALFSNVDGIQNTAVGNGTLYYNVSGYGNTATGNGALLNNGAIPNPLKAPEGSYNQAYGFFSLFNNSTGSYNAGFGASALSANTTGGYNTGIGSFSDVASEDLMNATAIGANSLVNSSNKIRLGDVNVTIVESAAGSWTTSDGRFKTNVKEEVVGLPFINLLRPVVYTFDTDKFDSFLSQSLPDSIKAIRKKAMKKMAALSKNSHTVQTGFIAQEVATAAKQAGYNYNGVHIAESAGDNYSLSYEKLVVPLVKSVQELSAQNEAMRKEIELLTKAIAVLQGNRSNNNNNITNVLLQQNSPNPAAKHTSIAYTLPPAGGKGAAILITDKQGRLIQKIALPAKTNGAIDIDTTGFSAGTYQYTLYANGSAVSTKQMIVSK